jgi:hypothetical protein
MDEHRIPKRLLEMKVTGKKSQRQTTKMGQTKSRDTQSEEDNPGIK